MLSEVYEANPHIQEAFTRKNAFRRADRTMLPADRIMAYDSEGRLGPRLPYTPRPGQVRTVDHWGQRKLFLSEVEFMLTHGHLASTVVYAGAAPGTHILHLTKLFPDHRWVLVDPAPFKIRQSRSVAVKQFFFTDEMAEEYAGKDVLFISDIRSVEDLVENQSTDKCVEFDLRLQERWVRTMRPKAAMVKFRFPYTATDADLDYLDGDIYYPVWGGRMTSETRLIVTDPVSAESFNFRSIKLTHIPGVTSKVQSFRLRQRHVSLPDGHPHDILRARVRGQRA